MCLPTPNLALGDLHRILLKSSTGQIDVYLVQHTNNVGAATSQADGTAEEPQASTAGHGQAQAQPHQQAQPQAHGQAPLPQHQQHQHQGELPHGQLPPTVVKQEQGLLRQGIGGAGGGDGRAGEGRAGGVNTWHGPVRKKGCSSFECVQLFGLLRRYALAREGSCLG